MKSQVETQEIRLERKHKVFIDSDDKYNIYNSCSKLRLPKVIHSWQRKWSYWRSLPKMTGIIYIDYIERHIEQ